jgi:anhydro-N-acetylmuramic acid kinase
VQAGRRAIEADIRGHTFLVRRTVEALDVGHLVHESARCHPLNELGFWYCHDDNLRWFLVKPVGGPGHITVRECGKRVIRSGTCAKRNKKRNKRLEPCKAIGLMSGTSIDGIDVAAIQTDGDTLYALGPTLSVPYAVDLRASIRRALGELDGPQEIEQELTVAHAAAVRRFLEETGGEPDDFDVVGFHGHTIAHRPDIRRTRQIGDGQRLARELGIDVVAGFRLEDVAAGGQGAPLAPIYHAHLLKYLSTRGANLNWPIAVINIGGVANITYIDEKALDDPSHLLAFDTGPGNALLDDWVKARTGNDFDRDGELAASGSADNAIVDALLNHEFFDQAPPKSLDRDAFATDVTRDLSIVDGAATLTAFTVGSIAKAIVHLPARPSQWLLTGGGRHNRTLCQNLEKRLGVVVPIEDVGGRGDSLEAEAFAHIAVRALRRLPITFPRTTGVPRPITGGVIHRVR